MQFFQGKLKKDKNGLLCEKLYKLCNFSGAVLIYACFTRFY